MRNKKTWLIIKLVLIILLTLVLFTMPTADPFRKWIRFIMLTAFVISFIIDLTRYKKNNG